MPSAIASRLKSWKTTLAGITAFLALITPEVAKLLDDDPETVASWTIVVAAFSALFGGFNARDNGVSSEQAGAGVIPPK